MSELIAVKVADLRVVGVRIFELLDEMEEGARRGDEADTKGTGLKLSDAMLARIARAIVKQRQLRREHLPAELFSEPAWDILLDLFIAHVDQDEISVTSACLATPVPATTALRWIDIVTSLGLVERYGSSEDKRVKIVRLTKSGCSALRNYLTALHAKSDISPIAGALSSDAMVPKQIASR